VRLLLLAPPGTGQGTQGERLAARSGSAAGTARYQVAKKCPEDPQEWLRQAENGHGTWWPDYASWLAQRCGEERAAPEELGGRGLEPLGDAPGTYVYDH
jgi:poly(3-hydroxyalkanoate) synthetase